MHIPLIVNIFGGPGAGKSTTRAGVFQTLKIAGVNCEEVTEVAKNLTWEKRHKTLELQAYIHGKQLRDMERLFGQVDVIITDSPTLLCRFYGLKYAPDRYDPTFWDFIANQFKRMGGINYYVNRANPYNPAGRNQTEDEAKQFDVDLREMLDELEIQYTQITADREAAGIIAADVIKRLNTTKTG